MAHTTIQSALRLLYPLFAVLVVVLSSNVAAHTEVSVSSPAYVLESTTHPTQVPSTLLSQCGAHICCINAPAEQNTAGAIMSYSGPVYASYQQVAVASAYSPDIPPPR